MLSTVVFVGSNYHLGSCCWFVGSTGSLLDVHLVPLGNGFLHMLEMDSVILLRTLSSKP